MIILLLFLDLIFSCSGMETSIKLCREINISTQKTIGSIAKKIPKKLHNSTFAIYTQLGSELHVDRFLAEYQEIESLINKLYAGILKDLTTIYSIKSALKEVSHDELKKDCKHLIAQEIAKQTAICLPAGEPNENDLSYIKTFLSKNDLLPQHYKIAFYDDNAVFSLFGNNDSRDLKLTILAFAYVDKFLEEIYHAVNQKKLNRQLFSSPMIVVL